MLVIAAHALVIALLAHTRGHSLQANLYHNQNSTHRDKNEL